MAARKVRSKMKKQPSKVPEAPPKPKRRRRRVRIRLTAEFRDKVTAALKARGEASANQLAGDVGVSAGVVRRVLKRLAARQEIVAVGDKRKRWRLTKTASVQPRVAVRGKRKGPRAKVISSETIVLPTGVIKEVKVEKPGAKANAPAPSLPGRFEIVEKLIESVKAELSYLTSIQSLLGQEDQMRGQIKALLEHRFKKILWE